MNLSLKLSDTRLVSPKSIYIHLPFCKTKCPYCDFASFADHNKERQQQYINALCNEINFRMYDYKPESREIKTIFFGGGTPSVHSAEQYRQIFEALRKHFEFAKDIEITLEANPGTIDRNKLHEFKDIGINRISIGAQTLDPDLLIKLGRGHSIDDTLQAIADIKAVNFNSWSLDLIYGLPGQKLESWQQTLKQVLDFQPPHISAYALSIEERTPYGEIYKNSYHPDLPIEDLVISMYETANELFKNNGILRYEISNWALPRHEAKHNLTYWLAEEYYAFGLSAHGYIDSKRYRNIRELEKYLHLFLSLEFKSKNYAYDFSFTEDLVHIAEKEKLEEKILLGLRLKQGIKMNKAIHELINKNNLDKNINSNLLILNGDHLMLNDSAWLISNRVISDLLV